MNVSGWRHGVWVLALLPALIQATERPAPEFARAWVRAVPPGTPVMAGYVDIVNHGTGGTRIGAVESQSFGAIEVHEMREVDGVMRMRPLPELRVEAGETVSLAPGGLHLMLFRPVRDFAPGERIGITFLFDDGVRSTVEFEVRAAQ